MDHKQNIVCIDNPLQGAALYCLDTQSRVRNYEVPIKKSVRPCQVAFAEDCSKIIVGSDHGHVYVFDRQRGEMIEQLSIASNVWLQTITVHRRTL